MATIIKTSIDGFSLRMAEKKDAALILQFIKDLAVYEKLEDQVVATEDCIAESIFEKKQAEVIIGEFNNEPVSFTLIYYPYSTFIGGVYLYLEDLFVKESYRNRGFGKEIFKYLAQLALDRGCKRMEWWCLDWNENSNAFYKKLGAIPMDDFTTFRMSETALKELAAR